jgi:hypothetical protein
MAAGSRLEVQVAAPLAHERGDLRSVELDDLATAGSDLLEAGTERLRDHARRRRHGAPRGLHDDADVLVGKRLLDGVVSRALDVILVQHGDHVHGVDAAHQRADILVLAPLVELRLAVPGPLRRRHVRHRDLRLVVVYDHRVGDAAAARQDLDGSALGQLGSHQGSD